MLLPRSRQGVPVLKRPTSNPNSCRLSLKRGDGIAHPAAGLVAQSDMEQPAHERACGHDDCTGRKRTPKLVSTPAATPSLTSSRGDIALLEIEMRLFSKNGLHPELVGLLVTLRARARGRLAPCVH